MKIRTGHMRSLGVPMNLSTQHSCSMSVSPCDIDIMTDHNKTHTSCSSYWEQGRIVEQLSKDASDCPAKNMKTYK